MFSLWGHIRVCFKDVDSIGRLRVVFDIALVLFLAEPEAATDLAHILFVTCYA